ncbi:polyketide synthase [Streptomyces sp. MAR4 CNX-425]|uniref:beta-ketoacyl [acyl carrier protein] synthase domain-containing protein n=1 Tax=Streptomyces sp. MAR4 CNX-425 TaxID=3406343 RepID=UPI003B511FD2
MQPPPEPVREPRRTALEPVAIVGIAALYPHARGPAGYWDLLTGNTPAPADGPQTLDDLSVDVAQFGIPPAQTGSMARMQVLALEAARQCLRDAGHPGRPLPAERTDVIVGTCFGLDRQYANAARVEGQRLVRDLRQTAVTGARLLPPDTARQAAEELAALMLRRLGCSPHDRVGEMASTIPARIAAAFKLRGRTLALEAAGTTSFAALAHAVTNLRGRTADAALVVAGQRQESPLLARALAAKGEPADPAGVAAGVPLSEGVGAVLLKPLSAAVRDGDRIYATVLDCTLRHDAGAAVGEPRAAGRRRATALTAYRALGVPAATVQYHECAAATMRQASELETLLDIYADLPERSVVLGSVHDRLGDTFANSGLASLTKVALALHHRTLPPQPSFAGRAQDDLSGTPFRVADAAEEWPRGGPEAPRRAAVTGTSVTGTLCHLVLEGHDRPPPAAGARRRTRRPLPRRHEPIAVVGAGGSFAGAPDADRFWEAVLSARDRIGPLPEALFDRDLFYAPDRLSPTHSYSDRGAPVRVPDEPPPGTAVSPARYAEMDQAQRLGLTVAAELLAGPRAGPPPAGNGLVAIGSSLSLSREREVNAAYVRAGLERSIRGLAALAKLGPADLGKLLDQLREGRAHPDEALTPAFFDATLASGAGAAIADVFGLRAVPVAVEAACASSLAAVDVAVGALRSGAADYAVAGGVELPCNPRDMVLCCGLGLLSHSTITPFDAAADGFTPGDGCALFLLKRLADARAAGDPVLGVLRAVGASNDVASLIAPDAAGQVRAMRRAFAQVDFAPADVDYLEAHGTGTRIGDRVEVSATAEVYGTPARPRPLQVGSAKSVFGHTFAAAGAAGLLRALKALHHGLVPPNANLTTLSPDLPLDAVPAVVATAARPWPAPGPGRPRRAAVSSFGTGGINYHLLIEEHLDGADAAP